MTAPDGAWPRPAAVDDAPCGRVVGGTVAPAFAGVIGLVLVVKDLDLVNRLFVVLIHGAP